MFTNLLRRKRLGTASPLSFTIRQAVPGDAAALARLAALDSREVPREPVLLAEVGDELWAAVSMADLHTVADPFRPSGELAFTLLERAKARRRGRGVAAPLPRPRVPAITG